VLRLRFDDSSRATRSHTLTEATAHTETILGAARDLLAAAGPLIAEKGITLVGVALTNLEDEHAIQLALPLYGSRQRALDAALDEIKERFGTGAIARAVLVGRGDPHLTVPLLPD
jgi:DNA polymerase-4